MPTRLALALGAAALAAATAILLAGSVAAQGGNPTGAEQTEASPPPLCATTISCVYAEFNWRVPNGYRLQMAKTCGANCETRYWVINAANGQVLLATEPARNGLFAVGLGSGPDDGYTPVRTIFPAYTPADAMCCPS